MEHPYHCRRLVKNILLKGDGVVSCGVFDIGDFYRNGLGAAIKSECCKCYFYEIFHRLYAFSKSFLIDFGCKSTKKSFEESNFFALILLGLGGEVIFPIENNAI